MHNSCICKQYLLLTCHRSRPPVATRPPSPSSLCLAPCWGSRCHPCLVSPAQGTRSRGTCAPVYIGTTAEGRDQHPKLTASRHGKKKKRIGQKKATVAQHPLPWVPPVVSPTHYDSPLIKPRTCSIIVNPSRITSTHIAPLGP